MSADDMEPLAPDLRDLLSAERARVPGLGVDKAHARARLSASVQLVGAVKVASSSTHVWMRIARWLATFTMGGLVGVASDHWFRSPPIERVVTVTRVVHDVVDAQVPIVNSVGSAADAETAQAVTDASVASHRVAPRADEAGVTTRDDLAAEREIIDIARTAVARGQSTAAIEALERHRARYPRGQLAEERDGLWVQALVSAGQTDAAREHGARFLRQHPGSLLRPVVESALRSLH